MVIQNIIFPDPEICTEEELYFRKKDGEISFDTYFNGFSVGKWKKYTKLSNLFLELETRGEAEIVIRHFSTAMSTEGGDDTQSADAAEENSLRDRETVSGREILRVKISGKAKLSIGELAGEGIYAFSFRPVTKDAELLHGAYTTELREEADNVRIGLCICTYNREEYISRNLGILKRTILERQDSPLFGSLEIFISDNGRNLDHGKYASDKVHIFPNRNLGGAGGFTRDLIEITRYNRGMDAECDGGRITHALLMDDDVIIEPEALLRTFSMLRLLKDEHRGAFIGGAMLRRDRMYEQAEAGACWNSGAHFPYKPGADLRDIKNVIANETEEDYEYNAWWYCCFPIDIVRRDNLPLPIFIRDDDLEYGLRNMKKLILLNGICLWHEPFEYKYSSFLQYYLLRNQLIVNSFHCPQYGVKEALTDIKLNCRQYVMFYRYKDLDLFLKGVEDFLKGPGFLMETDGEKLHREIMAEGYKYGDVSGLEVPFDEGELEKNLLIRDSLKAKILRLATLNGLFLPAGGDTTIPAGTARSNMTFRKKRVLNYDMSSEKGFVTARSFKQSLAAFGKMHRVGRLVKQNLARVQKEYKQAGAVLRSLEFWERYLDITDDGHYTKTIK